jgi:DNA-binding XRE family transcriptional regulator
VTKQERRLARQYFGSQHVVAELLGLTKRTIIRYEQARKAPRWYELALVGLRAEKNP